MAVLKRRMTLSHKPKNQDNLFLFSSIKILSFTTLIKRQEWMSYSWTTTMWMASKSSECPTCARQGSHLRFTRRLWLNHYSSRTTIAWDNLLWLQITKCTCQYETTMRTRVSTCLQVSLQLARLVNHYSIRTAHDWAPVLVKCTLNERIVPYRNCLLM